MKTKKINVGFQCGNCGHNVPPHPTSSRDHCNECLHSKHVDIIPGDRKNTCGGDLKPVGYLKSGDKEQILYKCGCCNGSARCVVAPDDNRSKIIELSQTPVPFDMLSPQSITHNRPGRHNPGGKRYCQ
jgi:hypothetical protein